MKLRLAVLFLASASLSAAGERQIALPIYIEDNHAGSFHWLAQHLDLEEPCTLLHFDAHSEASSIFDSDRIRSRLRRVNSLGERRDLLEQWRRDGTIQCFNWIEPLMPSPIAQVIWVPGEMFRVQSESECSAKPQLTSMDTWKPRRARPVLSPGGTAFWGLTN